MSQSMRARLASICAADLKSHKPKNFHTPVFFFGHVRKIFTHISAGAFTNILMVAQRDMVSARICVTLFYCTSWLNYPDEVMVVRVMCALTRAASGGRTMNGDDDAACGSWEGPQIVICGRRDIIMCHLSIENAPPVLPKRGPSLSFTA